MAVFIKAALMCISVYIQIPVNVCLHPGGPQRKHRWCVCGCQVRLWRLHLDVSHLITDLCFFLFAPTRFKYVRCTRERETGSHRQRFWRLMPALRPLMTPSILSPANHADYQERHLLTLYANETQSRSNEKKKVTHTKREG